MIHVTYKTKKDRIFEKTRYRCSICGSYDNLGIRTFIPSWIKVPKSYDNFIPMCERCINEKLHSFIELGEFQYLPNYYKTKSLLYYYNHNRFIRKYIYDNLWFVEKENLDLQYNILIMKSYDIFIDDNSLVGGTKE